MALDGNHDSSLNDAPYLVVAALADGEPVDPNALKAALGDPSVREYLVDLIALRQSVATLSELPLQQWRARRWGRSRVAWIAAVASMVFSVTAGYFAGQRAVRGAPAPIVETFVDLGTAVAAPKPTRVVALQPGVNWTENSGER